MMHNNNTIISVGISFYNAEQYLGQAIQSVINQSFSSWELILLDDGSTDKSIDIAKSYAAEDSRISVHSDGCNKGLAKRLNELVSISRGHYFARMDADDIMHQDRLMEQYNYLQSHPEVNVLGTNAITIDTANNSIGMMIYKEKPSSIEDVLSHNCFIHPSVMGVKQWFVENPYDSTAVRMEDFNLWLRTIEHSNFYNLQKSLMYYRTNGLPYTKKYIQSMKGEYIELSKNRKRIPHYRIRVFKIIVKCILYIIFGLIGRTDILLKLRTKHSI